MNKYYNDLDLLFIILTGKVSLVVNRALVRGFRAVGIDITADQYAVMSRLWKNDGCTQQELCDETNKDKPSMTRLIDNLEKQNLVSRVADRTDRRNNLIYLTHAGKYLKEKTENVVLEIVKQGLGGVSDDKINVCRVVLKNVLENLK